MAGPTGFEPATSRLTIWRPNQAERRPLKVCVWRKIQNNKITYTVIGYISNVTFSSLISKETLFRAFNHRGRRNRDRTCDLCLVRAALSQLSYPPDFLGNTGGGYQVPVTLSTSSRTLFSNTAETGSRLSSFMVMIAMVSRVSVSGNIGDGLA